MACNHCSLLFFEACVLKDFEIETFLIEHKIINSETECRKCKHIVKLKSWVFHCLNRVSFRKQKKTRCDWKVSARTGSLIEKSKLNIIIIWRLILTFLLLNPPRQKFLNIHLGLSAGTIVRWYLFIRKIYKYDTITTSEQLGGPGEIVDFYKVEFGKRKSKREKLVKGNCVFGGVQRGTLKSFLLPVKRYNRRALIKVVKKWVKSGSTVVIDSRQVYNILSSYNFTNININLKQDDPLLGHTNSCDWQNIRNKIPKHCIRRKDFFGYLSEYLFMKKYPPQYRLHHFFITAAKLYPAKY